ncbi:hypothetical protein Fmac_025410 [Flemingia macrophylla]|uniref:Uncharacterized protein n=1 Tax=Flemingia macrophylla TaxID=520843 RepID=A0ABD1LS48_9FABA
MWNNFQDLKLKFIRFLALKLASVQNRFGGTEVGMKRISARSRGVLTSIHADRDVKAAFFDLSGSWRGDAADIKIEQMFEVGEWGMEEKNGRKVLMLPFMESKQSGLERFQKGLWVNVKASVSTPTHHRVEVTHLRIGTDGILFYGEAVAL